MYAHLCVGSTKLLLKSHSLLNIMLIWHSWFTSFDLAQRFLLATSYLSLLLLFILLLKSVAVYSIRFIDLWNRMSIVSK